MLAIKVYELVLVVRCFIVQTYKDDIQIIKLAKGLFL